jgi:hypothetical protein
MNTIISFFKKNLPLIFYSFVLMGVFLYMRSDVLGYAQDSPFQIIKINGGTGKGDLGDLLSALVKFLRNLAYPVAILVITVGGFRYYLGATDDGKTDGIKTIQAGVIGFAIILMADAIGALIGDTFKGGTIDAAPLTKFIQDGLIKNLTILAVGVATLAMIWGGYKDFMKAFEEKTSGTESVKYAVFGLSVIFIAGSIAQVMSTALAIKDGQPQTLTGSISALFGEVQGLLTSTTGIFTATAVIFSVLVIAKGGYDYYLNALADSKQKGIETIRLGITGLAISLLAGFISNVVVRFLGNGKTIDNVQVVATTDYGGAAKNVLVPLLTNGFDFMLALSSVVTVLVIAYGGYQYFFASLPDSKAKGKETITNGVIGLLVVLFAKPLQQIINATLKVTGGAADAEIKLSLEPAAIINFIRVLLSNILIPVSSVVTVFFLVLGGYYWITSNGSDEQVKKARTAIQNAVIGLVILLLSTTIVQLIIFFVKPGEFTAPSSGFINVVNNILL